ncbi:MAG: hypothetical protein N2595_10870, partial [bacterium]|nr:hypothetical protein [bacterium]
MRDAGVEYRDIPWRVGGVGFSALLAQVLLVREAGVWLRGNELIIGMMLAAWLSWGALGSMSGYTIARRRFRRGYTWIWVVGCVIAVGELIVLRCCWPWTGKIAGATTTMGRAVVLACVVTAVPAWAHSYVCGTLIERWERGTGESIARLYLCETVGAAVAGLIVTFYLIPAGIWWVSVGLVACVPFLTSAWMSRARWVGMIANGLCAVGLVVVWWAGGTLDRWAREWAGRFLAGELVAVFDLPRAHVAVTRSGDEHAFYYEGRLVGSTRQREYAEELVGYAVGAAGGTKRALLIGFLYNGVVRELAQRGVEVAIVDPLAPYLWKFASFLLPEDAAVLRGPKVLWTGEDSRTWLRRQERAGCGPFDVVIQDVGVPESYAGARYYSREWFELVRQRMSKRGAFVVVLPGTAGLVPEDFARLLERVRETLRGVFGHVVVVPASATLVIASPGEELVEEPGWWVARLEERGWSGEWLTPVVIEDQLNMWRRLQFSNACARVGRLRAHTDVRPYGYGDAICYYEARFGGMFHRLVLGIYMRPLWTLGWACVLIGGWVTVTWVAARGGWVRLAAWGRMSAGSTGGFIAQMLVIVRFVAQEGGVYYALGALFGRFMLG